MRERAAIEHAWRIARAVATTMPVHDIDPSTAAILKYCAAALAWTCQHQVGEEFDGFLDVLTGALRHVTGDVDHDGYVPGQIGVCYRCDKLVCPCRCEACRALRNGRSRIRCPSCGMVGEINDYGDIVPVIETGECPQ